jgi:hypothetical protein
VNVRGLTRRELHPRGVRAGIGAGVAGGLARRTPPTTGAGQPLP